MKKTPEQLALIQIDQKIIRPDEKSLSLHQLFQQIPKHDMCLRSRDKDLLLEL